MLLFHDTDYINASLIDLNNNGVENKYIATQAPLESTCLAFWLMVMERKCPVIVMLTELIEGFNIKADKYWPNEVNQTIQFNTLNVTLVKEIKHQQLNYTERHIVLKLYQEVHYVVQLHYHGWSDHGTPDNVLQCIKIANHMENIYKTSDNNSRPIVHCSAGVGRAGTFIGVHMLLCLLRSESFVYSEDIVPNIILQMRKFRCGMVQRECQLEFIYKSLIYYQEHLDVLDNKYMQIGEDIDIPLFGDNNFNSLHMVPTMVCYRQDMTESGAFEQSEIGKTELSSSGE